MRKLIIILILTILSFYQNISFGDLIGPDGVRSGINYGDPTLFDEEGNFIGRDYNTEEKISFFDNFGGFIPFIKITGFIIIFLFFFYLIIYNPKIKTGKNPETNKNDKI